ncbi:MAG TPA: class I SAM-dependent methyltransferase [Solirubrobacteraceae bacterium]
MNPAADAWLAAPPGYDRLPPYGAGWLLETQQLAPYLSYVAGDEPVNWSDELEALHEDATRTHFIDRWTRAAVIARLGDVPSDGILADVGCSTGHLLENLRDAYPGRMLVGVDLVAAGLRKAHALVPNARLLHADACALPLADASMDAIASANLLEHVVDDVGALREFARVLRPGSRAVMVVPAGPRTYDYYDRFLGHERRYARGELAAKARAVGLEVVEDAYIGSLLYPAFWMVKQRNRLLYDDLAGAALERRVTSDIERTDDSRWGERLWRIEERLKLPLPFGIRNRLVARRTAQP